MPDKKWVMLEQHTGTGWVAIEGKGNGNEDVLVVHDSREEAEEAIEQMLEDFRNAGVPGYEYPNESFRAGKLTPETMLREDLRRN